ncbi:hypothetical protein CPC16_008730 [Podila verticillata]|nr:hypothetical protein BGZ59_011087 [Podila verticillata]KAF9383848.1 hypothetical protein CPC16_008730 [Podila verticillata]KFH71714.1 hypothetical protein MVEG_02009 [Podila verticillata NRRL 6337]
MKTYRSTGLVALAVLAMAALHLSNAAPVLKQDAMAVLEEKADFYVHLEKRPATDDPTTKPPPATHTNTPATSTPNKPPASRTTSDPAKPKPTEPPAGNSNTSTNSHTTSTSRAGSPSSGVIPPAITSSGTPPTTTAPAGEGTVPTGVSKGVLIGLGTVGGLIVFALGGFAFCRHRKKKNLASALLQQTAQFNNNNPYAKLPEPATPKESLPMTPTKPLGTYNVVATYTPALADEIEIGLGDSVTILQEYDDGWCMGVNNTRNGIKGVFPRHCVEMGPYEGSQHGAPGGPHFPPSPSFKATANKRMSSIAPPGGWNDGYGGHGGQNYPPQPSPQHMGPPQGGGYY